MTIAHSSTTSGKWSTMVSALLWNGIDTDAQMKLTLSWLPDGLRYLSSWPKSSRILALDKKSWIRSTDPTPEVILIHSWASILTKPRVWCATTEASIVLHLYFTSRRTYPLADTVRLAKNLLNGDRSKR